MLRNTSITSRQADWLLRLLIVGAVVVVFWPVLQGNWVSWDDGVNITENHHLTLNWEGLYWMFTDSSYVPRYMPLGWLSYSLDLAIFGKSPVTYHGGNMLLHALNALLLYAIIKRLLALWKPGNEMLQQCAAATAALWWAVNPLRTEPVAWASSRIYCVAALFFFLAVLFYLRQLDANKRLEPGASPKRWAVWLAAFFFAASLFTYPIVFGGLAVFVILDAVIGRLPSQILEWRRRQYWGIWAEKLLFLLPALLCFYANWQTVEDPDRLLNAPPPEFKLECQFMQSCWMCAWYVWKAFLPFDLAPRYPDLFARLLFTPAHCIAAIIVVAFTAFAFLGRRRWAWLPAAWICHVALLAPFMSEHLHCAYDRYSYIVNGVLAVVVAGGVLLAFYREKLRVLLGAIMVLWCAFIGWEAQQQTFFWNNSLHLHTWTAQVIGSHQEVMMHELYAGRLLLQVHRPDFAIAPARRCVVLRPDVAVNWALLGDVLGAQESHEAAIGSYQRALNLNPTMNGVRFRLGSNLAALGRYDEAIIHLKKYIARCPFYPEGHQKLAFCLQKLGRNKEAEDHLNLANSLANETRLWAPQED